MTKMDELLESVGAFGKFQYKTVLIVGLMSALTSGCIYATIFIAGEPTFICTRQEARQVSLNETYQDVGDACQIWSQIKDHQNKSNLNYTCFFDTQYYDKTIITEYNLVCERQYLAGLTQTSHILGSTFGFCGGIFGDKYGRRKSTLLFSFLLTACLIITQAALNITSLSVDVRYIVYTTGQFFVGLLVNCLYCTAYVLLLEFTTEEYHTKLANMNSYVYVMGELVVAVVYYFSRDWNVLCWFIGICSLALLVLAYYFLPESPAWLIESKQHKGAVKVLRQMAKFNGRKSFLIEFKQDDLTAMLASSQTWPATQSLSSFENTSRNNENANEKTSDALITQIEKDSSLSSSEEGTDEGSAMGFRSSLALFKDIFVPRHNFIKTSLLFYVWIALMLLYYGISLGVTSLDSVDPYLMYFLSTFAELVGYFCCYLNDIFGRKRTLSSFFFITAIVYGLNAYLTLNETEEFSPKAIFLLVLSLLGKCAISGAYNLIYIYTSELYPAAMRNTALIFLVCFGGTSSLVAPQINLLKSLIWNPLPYIVYSIFSLLSCLCIWYLPESCDA